MALALTVNILSVKGDIMQSFSRYNAHLHFVLEKLEHSFYELSRKFL